MRFMITLPEKEYDELWGWAERERRDVRDQAVIFLLESLRRRGPLPADPTPQPTSAVEGERLEPAD